MYFPHIFFSCPARNYIISSNKAFEGIALLCGKKRLITDLSALKIRVNSNWVQMHNMCQHKGLKVNLSVSLYLFLIVLITAFTHFNQ